jgi:hypothetical protein
MPGKEGETHPSSAEAPRNDVAAVGCGVGRRWFHKGINPIRSV